MPQGFSVLGSLVKPRKQLYMVSASGFSANIIKLRLPLATSQPTRLARLQARNRAVALTQLATRMGHKTAVQKHPPGATGSHLVFLSAKSQQQQGPPGDIA
ncbi:hypothetical protein CDD81_5702 [Ophiocordyceps australis]|uniref:Uncharacterized protein n=1 Tax=Ophiocordyceps australis TaxID=1399860 RepID=A0A2C5Y841_9HYPO|nr:hypothetical protein CDD81_5702 [Ophiocordyceps australis]